MPTDVKLPELGENIEGGDVLRVMVKTGDQIKKDQPVLELETDKATIEIPSSADGVIKDIKVKAGEKVKVGQTIFIVDDAASPSKNGGTAATAPQAAPQPAAAFPQPAAKPVAVAEAAKAQPPAEPSQKRRADVVEMKAKQPPAAAPPPAAMDAASIPAAPSARRLARELGVNLAEIHGSGAGGRISMDDVTAHARR